MTKKQLLATLAVSTLALAQAGVASADETTTSPVDGTTPVVVSPAETPVDQAQPSQPVETPNTGTTTPPATEAPVDPTTPTQPSENPTTPPTTEPVTPDPAPSDPVDPSTTTPSTPSEEPKSEDPTSPAPSEGNDQNTPAPTDPSTGEVPRDVKPMPEPAVTFNPFETPSGQTVVGTQNSQVIVRNTDGSTQTVKAEDVGGTTNSDGTVTLPTASGEAKTLPQTGEEGSLLSAIGLGVLSLVGVIFKKKAL
ncbi:LPXTG cell wall anchor domain-containing protein [Streptococcus agalactiae]|jgi:LPXTG-motif cell wall-anchored protein|uniref:LPXTG cell wall anchor domain-containing protein n=1 Tax=Streptococcus TaxID=1301 RepID=UPI001C21420B|nr:MULTISPECIES: LPXTG cell wall anchor domain-containing protein [Streptococcus]MBU8847269.1 LPXTG cell wall anchor domain-containing protein [Streptococcus agalactiae]MCD0101988.1 LPXTG cell wall anchor domain-containing protein [Streptococcus agalactiae]